MDKLEKKILEQSDEPNTKLPTLQIQRKSNVENEVGTLKQTILQMTSTGI